MLHKTALFPGSFDPFTLGHHSLVEKALTLFNRVVIAVGINEGKKGLFSPQKRVEMIKTLYAHYPNIEVEAYTGLTYDFAATKKAGFIVRGVRSALDFEFERLIAETNRSLSGIETVLLFSPPQLQHITSTVVRELLRFGQDVSTLLPPGMILPNREGQPRQD